MPATTHLPEAWPPRAPADDRAGCGCALLVMTALLGTLVCGVLAGTRLGGPPSVLPDQDRWDAYLLTALLWGTAAGAAAVVAAFAPSARGGRATARRIAVLDAGMALAILWPVQAAALAVRFATRRGLRPWIRPAVLALGTAALVGGGWWGATGYGEATPHRAAGVTQASLVGGWRTSNGGLLRLEADGRFTATGVSGGLFTLGSEFDDRTDAAGTWSYGWNSDTHVSGFTFSAGAAGGLEAHLDVYRTGSTLMLCVVEDPDTPCADGLTFLRVPGPAAAAR
ncbi:hypothetical protein [Streptomyces sp. NPDC049040]|uniref:hypothetical protein n=1 Tax=Streptomyces sp. NPDC049040 TaxID=3365593 RepID=UPI00371C097B